MASRAVREPGAVRPGAARPPLRPGSWAPRVQAGGSPETVTPGPVAGVHTSWVSVTAALGALASPLSSPLALGQPSCLLVLVPEVVLSVGNAHVRGSVPRREVANVRVLDMFCLGWMVLFFERFFSTFTNQVVSC